MSLSLAVKHPKHIKTPKKNILCVRTYPSSLDRRGGRIYISKEKKKKKKFR
jgi:hypothetical protein